MALIRSLAFVLLLAFPAGAADVIYPTASRIGLVPPPGMSPSRSFTGFEDAKNRVGIALAALPGHAFAEIEKSTWPELLAKQGMAVDKRESFAHPLGKAILAIGRQQVGGQPVHKWILVVSAGAIMLTDGAIQGAKPGAPGVDTHMVIAIAPGGPAKAAERGSFARDVFSTIPNLKDVRFESSEPLRITGAQGYQIIGRAKDGASGQEITVIQWLRFGGGAYLHYIGVARSEGWTPAYARFRQVRDGIEAR
jgi:hypothetical protein